MATTLSIDAEMSVGMMGTAPPRLRVRCHESAELPPCDVQVTVSRSLPPHLIRAILAEAEERLCRTDDAPRLRPSPRRVTA